MKSVLMIDFLNEGIFDGYTLGLCDELYQKTNLTLCCCYSKYDPKKPFKMLPFFFKKSDKMKKSVLRIVVRSFEYFLGYLRLYKYIKHNPIDIIHIQWARFKIVDCFFLKRIKRYVKKIVFTSHDVFDHVKGQKEIKENKKFHKLIDTILVHGNAIKEEYLKYYPEDDGKVFLQYHGFYSFQKKDEKLDEVGNEIKTFLNKNHMVAVAFLGYIFYNKGVDRLLKYWLDNCKDSSNFLIVAGTIRESYSALDNLVVLAKTQPNILFLPRFLNESEFAYILKRVHLVALPYRHASMSGVFFSAANFDKTIIYTDTGAIKEYANDKYCFRSDNSYSDFANSMNDALSKKPEELDQMGHDFSDDIKARCSWSEVADYLNNIIYK